MDPLYRTGSKMQDCHVVVLLEYYMKSADIYTLIKERNLSVSTDSRTAGPGTIYIGLKGDLHDGNSYAGDAIKQGAEYAVVDNSKYKKDDRIILVDDSYKTLQELAHIHRMQFSIPILVIGGSNGKTTTKELISAVLSKKHLVHTTKGNLNNHVGVPLTLLSMPITTEIGIIEIGANHPGEHAELMKIVEPTHVLVTNNGADHLEGFGSVEGVRAANKEIYDWAHAKHATIFVNKEIVDLCEDTKNMNRVLYPIGDYKSSSDMYAAVTYNNIVIKTQLVGSLNELNILAAIAVGEYFKVPMEQMTEAFAGYVPTLKRSQLIVQGSTNVVLDCYNANPSSMELSLRDFFKVSNGHKRIIIIGDMLEIGETEQVAHLEVLNQIKDNIKEDDMVLCVGPVLCTFKDKFLFQFFQNSDDASETFNRLDLNNSYVFLKASRGIKLENVINKKIAL